MQERIEELEEALKLVQTALANHRDNVKPVLTIDNKELSLEEVKYLVVDEALAAY